MSSSLLCPSAFLSVYLLCPSAFYVVHAALVPCRCTCLLADVQEGDDLEIERGEEKAEEEERARVRLKGREKEDERDYAMRKPFQSLFWKCKSI